MTFASLIIYARLHGLSFERIALRQIILRSGAEFPYRETYSLTDGGWWVDAAILNARWRLFCQDDPKRRTLNPST